MNKFNFHYRLNLPNLRDISLPIEGSNRGVQENLKQQITDGVYSIGELIVPQSYEKTSLVNNEIVREEIKLEGRKIPLSNIRSNMLQNQLNFMRLRSDSTLNELSENEIIKHLKFINEYKVADDKEDKSILLERLKKFERTRNLMVWHDCSTVSNHSHFLVMIATMYDPAVYLTNKEYFTKFGEQVDVQATVEQPNLYIFGRCPSNDQQLLYSDERIEDILQLEQDLETEKLVKITDVMRVFKGDNPAVQLEAGQQKGGHYFCCVCGIKACFVKSLYHSLGLKYTSLQDRVEKILSSYATAAQMKQQNTKYFSNLKKHEIATELQLRGVKYQIDASVKDLKELLDEEMHGIQRLPALMFFRPHLTLAQLNLQSYEILSTEPLHDISNHTKNLYSELPHKFSNQNRHDVEEIIKASFNGKEAKNSSDYRESLLIVCSWLIQYHPDHFATSLLKSFAEIQEIMYLPDSERDVYKVLRLSTTVFVHSILIQNHIQGKLHALTERKFFGAYYHAIVAHAPQQYRLFSGRSINTEKEEATFHNLKNATNLASNHRPDHVIKNAIIRLQARKKLNGGKLTMTKESNLKKIYLPIKEIQENTIIPYRWIKSNSSQYQRLLERISDYLLEGKWWMETNLGVEFFDYDTAVTSVKQIHHFRSTSLKEEYCHLDECWQLCLAEENRNILIPAFKIKVVENNLTKSIYLKTLKFFEKETENQNQEDTFEKSFEFEEEDKTLTAELTSTPALPPLDFSIVQKNEDSKFYHHDNTPSLNLTLHDNSSESTKSNKETLPLVLSSTPIHLKPEKTGTNHEIVSIKPLNYIFLPEQYNSKLGKTATLMQKVFGNEIFIQCFDKKWRAVKKNKSKENISKYKCILAQVEIKLHALESQIKKQIHDIDVETLTKHDIHHTDDKYKILVDKLRYIKVIKRTLEL